MQPRRRAGSILLVGVLVGLLAACSNSPSSAKRFEGDDSAASTTGVSQRPSSTLPRTPDGLETLRLRLSTLVGGGEATAIDIDGDVVAVALKPGREALAEELAATYPGLVRITVGATVYGPTARSPRCGTLDGQDLPAGVELELTLAQPSVRAIDGVSGSVKVTNRRTSSLHLELPAQLQAIVLATSTRQVLTRAAPLPATPARAVDVAPFDAITIPVVLAVSRCDGGPGSLLPPGRYVVRVAVPVAVAGPRGSDLISPQVALFLTA